MPRPTAVAALLCILALPALTGCAGDRPPGYPYRIESLYGVEDPQFLRTMGSLLGPPIEKGNKAETLVNGDQIFPAMLAAIRSAKTSVTFETFIFWEGDVGRQFTDALCDRAASGVKVHLLMDAVGSTKMDGKYVDRMKKAGVEVQFYRPLAWFELNKIDNRSHRKLLIVDGRVGFTGGVGIADDWLGNAQDAQHWRDNHYRLTGPAVAHLQAAFADHWIETNGAVLHVDEYFPPLEPAGEQLAQVFQSAPDGGSESMQLMFLLSFASARQSIRLATPYFVPDELTIRTLLAARGRGVRVQVIVPNRLTDVPAARYASRELWGDLLKAGVEVYEFQPTMYHCKQMVVDDLWVSIGSANVDQRSFSLDHEANLNVWDAGFAAEQGRVFDADLARAKRITYEAWKGRPFGERVKEALSLILKPQL